jgi:tetratricopeptide (TPR) repeat protein
MKTNRIKTAWAVGFALIAVTAGLWFFLLQDLWVLSAAGKKAETIRTFPGRLVIGYPWQGSLFPPEFPAPRIEFRDSTAGVSKWIITVRTNGGMTTAACRPPFWRPDSADWEKIKTVGLRDTVWIAVAGIRNGAIASGARVGIKVSADSVGGSIFFRAVPLPFSYALTHLDSIQWRLGNVGSAEPPTTMLRNLSLCGNCHTFTADGRTLAMDVDYANDKGSYVIAPIKKVTQLFADEIITWSDFKRGDRTKTFGLLSQISPDGRYVVSMVRDRSIFVAVDSLTYSQLFFPIKGIIAVYNRQTRQFASLPGADDPAFVQGNPTWSPDGKWVYFAKAEKYDPQVLRSNPDIVLPVAAAKEFLQEGRAFKFDIYRIPFNEGRGGKAEPVPGASGGGMSHFFPRVSPDGKWLVYTRAKNFMLLQRDSRLVIIPAEGGVPRELGCNTGSMNSWHSWSPDSRWLVFASKLRGPYTQAFLTHIDGEGLDSPPVWLENFSQPERAVNIPEFVNVRQSDWNRIEDRFSDQSHYHLTIGKNRIGEGRYREAVESLEKTLSMDPANAEAALYLGHAWFRMGEYDQAVSAYERALAIEPTADVWINLGTAKYKLKDYRRAIEAYDKALTLEPRNGAAFGSRGSAKAKMDDYHGAVADFDKAESLGSLSASFAYERGLSKALLGDYLGAEADFEKTTRLDPNSADAWIKLGTALYQLKRFRDAEAAYGQAAGIPPVNREVFSSRGRCRVELADWPGALDDYDRAIRLAPNSVEDLYWRGFVSIRMGNRDEGCRYLGRASALGFKPASNEMRKHCGR